ncbi:MAG: DoxX family protein [Pyrinomonadaceae bacterium]
MSSEIQTAPVSKGMLWAGYIVSILPVLLLLLSASMKFIRPPGFAEGLEHMGWREDQMFYLGIVEITCTLLYLIPRTAYLGAILLTAYMGGAVPTHVRIGDPYFVQVLVGVFVWLGLYLRDPRIRALIPFKS